EHNVTTVDFLRDYFRRRRLATRPGLAPLAGGAVGFLGFDASRWFEPVLEKTQRHTSSEDDALFMLFRVVIAFDRVKQQMEITSVVFTDEADGDMERLKQLYEQAVAETEHVERQLDSTTSLLACPKSPNTNSLEFKSLWPRHEYEDGVKRIKEYIMAGDCYQAVLSQKFTAKVSAQPIDIYRALRATNPSPYHYCLRMGDESIIGASPEMLIRCRGRKLEYRPIAGTRKRGRNPEEDVRLGEEMRGDAKEVAEHMMLVDLGRNDLGRVAEFGSVKVDELLSIERYSHVQHLVSGLSATLDNKSDRFDALASCFPAGTLSGAPKVRAMQIIDELEPVKRGVYGGSVMYIDYDDNLDSCIAIRTLVLRNNVVEFQAGGGIVADSVPELEYEECINKSRALRVAIEMAERGL
ncbi:MAG: anthranilate synthase component I family protein, partial [Pyrinomonadaceae bacterium]